MTFAVMRSAAVGFLLACAGPAAAQVSPVYGDIDAQAKAELQGWAGHFWHKADTGDTVKPGAFKFSDPAMNSPVFLPLRGARTTLEAVSLVASADCDSIATPDHADAAVAQAFRLVMTEDKIVTDPQSDPDGAAAHMQLITAAPPGVTFWINADGTLVSVGLPLLLVDEAPNLAVYAGNVSPETEVAILKLMNSGPAIAKAAAGVTVAQGLITGEKDQAVRFAEGVQQLLFDLGSNGAIGQVEAAFGVYGSLPILSVAFDDAYVLLDTTTGSIDGPFELDSYLDARVLLAAHTEYIAGTSVRYYKEGGCSANLVAIWNTGGPPPAALPTTPRGPATPGPTVCPPGVFPPGTTAPPGAPAPPTPPATTYPTPPCYNPANPLGGWTACSWAVSPAGSTLVTVVSQEIGGTPPRVYHVVRYYNCGLATPGATGCPPAGCTLTGTQTWY